MLIWKRLHAQRFDVSGRYSEINLKWNNPQVIISSFHHMKQVKAVTGHFLWLLNLHVWWSIGRVVVNQLDGPLLIALVSTQRLIELVVISWFALIFASFCPEFDWQAVFKLFAEHQRSPKPSLPDFSRASSAVSWWRWRFIPVVVIQRGLDHRQLRLVVALTDRWGGSGVWEATCPVSCGSALLGHRPDWR